MIIAKNDPTQSALCEMLSRREIKKTYIAITCGIPHPSEGIIDTNISRSISNHVPLASTTTLMTINSLSMFKRNDDWHTHLEGVIKPGPVSSFVSQRPPEIESR